MIGTMTETRQILTDDPPPARPPRVGLRCTRCRERLPHRLLDSRSARGWNRLLGLVSEPLTWLALLTASVFLQLLSARNIVIMVAGPLLALHVLSLRCPNCGKWIRNTTLQRWKRGLCPRCGYNMTGNISGRCPECGDQS